MYLRRTMKLIREKECSNTREERKQKRKKTHTQKKNKKEKNEIFTSIRSKHVLFQLWVVIIEKAVELTLTSR
jgi:hypothetical protein